MAATRRRREIAIRLAMGASPSRIVGMIFAKAVGLSVISAAVGLAGGFVLSRAIASFLYEVRPTDPVIYAAACAIALAIALAASIVPAVKAARLDPVMTLKYE